MKNFGELSLKGITFPSPANQCWPEPVPYIYKNFAFQIFQQPDKITIIYDQDHEVRHLRLNESHPAEVTPSWYGDSVAHYEGGTLVIDTVGTKANRPFAMIDLYGTPYTEKLHVVERFTRTDANTIRYEVTIDDPNVYTKPWKVLIPLTRDADYTIYEYACQEGNEAVGNILRGGRAHDQAAK